MLIARGGLKNKHKKKPNQTTLDILVEDGHLTNRDEEKTDTFSAAFFFFFASVFNVTGRPWAAWSPRSED